MIRMACGVVAAVAAFLLGHPALGAAQRVPEYTCGGELPPAFATMVVLRCDTLPAGKHHLSAKASRQVAGSALEEFLTRTAADEGRAITNLRPTVYWFHDWRLEAYCGIATFAEQDNSSLRQTLEYNTRIWYVNGGIYLVTVATGTKHCLRHTVRVRFKSRRVTARKLAKAVVKKHLSRLYGSVKAVHVSGVKSRRAKKGDSYRRVRASFTFVHPDGHAEHLKQTLELVLQGVDKRGTWRVDLGRVR